MRYGDGKRAQGDKARAAEALVDLLDTADKRAPPQMGFHTQEQNDIILRIFPDVIEEIILGPLEHLDLAVVDLNGRAGHGEVEELLLINGTENLGLPLIDKMAHRQGGRSSGVVPAVEGGYEKRVAQFGSRPDLQIRVSFFHGSSIIV